MAMNLKQVAGFLGCPVEQARKLTLTGLKLPKSRRIVKLCSTKIGDRSEVSDEQLNAFIQRFEKEDPGRNPPVEVRRELLVEANHLCAICRKPLPLQFHHMLEWSTIRHHDAKHMLVLCGGCHDRCRIGQIDSTAQAMYKARLLRLVASSQPPDPQQATTTAKDKKTLTDMLRSFPSSWADMILAMAREDVWWYDRVPAMEGAARMLNRLS
jgi:hypothetical protein